MHTAWKKSSGHRHAVISISYGVNCIGVDIIWEQEVGGSNPLAPTKFLLIMLAGCVEFQPANFLDRLGDFAYFVPLVLLVTTTMENF